MKRLRKILAVTFAAALTVSNACIARAQVGDMGFFGGISEGAKLPKTTEILLAQTSNSSSSKNAKRTFSYKEMVFLSGQPYEFDGILEITSPGPQDNVNVGTYSETQRVYASQSTDSTVNITRSIVFTVNYRREGQQVIKDYTVKSWSESLTTPGGTFTLDPLKSSYGVSIIEDHTPAVTYYRGDISMHAVYEEGVTADSTGSFYGYRCAWSNTETHRMDVTVQSADWQMQYQIRPSVSVNKTLQYTDNEPMAISFEGNYKEVMQNFSGLKYDVYVTPRIYPDQETSGGTNITTQNTFEQLLAPDVAYLKGHPAEEDIKKLFSMQILEGNTKFYQPAQAITRGQYVTALVKAIKLPIETQQTTSKSKKAAALPIVFPDVRPERAEYPYIMAAYRNGLAIGRDNGNFYTDYALERQEAIVILLRTLGLSNLGLDPTPLTVFTDDYQIGGWAKREMAAAYTLGLIQPDDNGRIRPKELVTKAEAAALVNHLIEYMRSGLATDYADYIVNYPN